MPSYTEGFIHRWQQSSASERANYALFLSELCDFLDLPRPEPSQADEDANTYVIDKAVFFQELDCSTTTNYIDLYKRNCFVLEAKQGSNPQPEQPDSPFALTPPQAPRRLKRGTAVRGTHGWDTAMLAARGQAERYAKALPASEGWPPFLIVADVGHSIELFADFSLTGKAYLPFPGPRNFRILLEELEQTEIRDRLGAVWLDPCSLDPSRERAKVTREVAVKLATLARNLEHDYSPKEVAEFLTRCIFTSFAEDVHLLPERGWRSLLESLREDVGNFPAMVESLWQTMNEGGFSPILRSHILQFNGGLFASTQALPLNKDQLYLLIEAADSRWRDVEPAIFGTLLERALNPAERHALGAHYTPRAYVERLVVPTIVEPLREDWRSAQAAITEQVGAGDTKAAIETAQAFHRQLCSTRVLDPACGSGNFLYVALEHMKRLEGEVLETLHSLGQAQEALEHTGLTVDPHQLLGLELNPRAAVIADLVLWIGYLQWHFRTRGDAQPPIPVIRNFHNIVEEDAVITWKKKLPALDSEGDPVTQWDGATRKEHPTTGQQIPDEAVRRQVYEYTDVKQAKWPEADFVVGNPPFIGGKDIRSELGDGYVAALRKVYDDVPESADLVMYWWQRAAELARAGKIRRFGFVTTNSITQVFDRKVVAQNLNAGKDPLSLIFAIPDHPWLKALSPDETAATRVAAVRIAMTVGERGEHQGHLYRVVSEGDTGSEGTAVVLEERTGRIFADLRIGVDVSDASALRANEGLCCPGVKLHGAGFIVTHEVASTLGLGRIEGLEQHIRTYLNGRDLTGTPRNKMVIDLFGLEAAEVQKRFPEVYQWVHDRVKPERDQNRRATYSEKWWVFGEPRASFRPALKGLSRYISTVETAKHRIFVFLDASILPDNKLINFAFSDAFFLGVLSSRIHVEWALASGGRIGFGNDPVYVKTRCFDTFPFPVCTDAQKETIRGVAERVDAHRKRRQELAPWLTLTDMYNVLERLKSGEELTVEERTAYDAGLVGILRELHEELDAAVFAAYGWPAGLTDEEILGNVATLNAQRRAEEASGVIRWLRPEFQAPQAAAVQTVLGGFVPVEEPAAARRKQPWPVTLTEQVRAIKDALRGTPMQTPVQIASGFRPASRARVAEILETLTALGQTRLVEDKYLL
jgi:SAM-dependent methyltransferase